MSLDAIRSSKTLSFFEILLSKLINIAKWVKQEKRVKLFIATQKSC